MNILLAEDERDLSRALVAVLTALLQCTTEKPRLLKRRRRHLTAWYLIS